MHHIIRTLFYTKGNELDHFCIIVMLAVLLALSIIIVYTWRTICILINFIRGGRSSDYLRLVEEYRRKREAIDAAKETLLAGSSVRQEGKAWDLLDLEDDFKKADFRRRKAVGSAKAIDYSCGFLDQMAVVGYEEFGTAALTQLGDFRSMDNNDLLLSLTRLVNGYAMREELTPFERQTLHRVIRTFSVQHIPRQISR